MSNVQKKPSGCKRLIIALLVFLALAIVLSGAWLSHRIAENKMEHEVTFYSNDGTVLKVDIVRNGQPANPPAKLQMLYGTIFKAWDADISKITSSIDVNPICECVTEKSNVFAVESAYGKSGGTVVVPVRLCGEVCTAGFDLTINYDPAVLELISVQEDGGVIYSDEKLGEIKLNYVSTDNTKADVDLCYLEFSIKAEAEESAITMKMNKIFAYDEKESVDDIKLGVPKYTIINGTVFVLPQGE